MDPSWERYLWRHNLLALDPLADHAESLRLLDILVKTGNEGWSRRPTICKVGSLCAFRSDEDAHADWVTTKPRIEEGLQQLVGVKSITSDFFLKDEHMETYDCHSSTGCGVLASILAALKSGGIASSFRRIAIHSVVYEMVQADKLNDLVVPRGRNAPAQWKPDIPRIKLVSRGADDPKDLELWIVTEIRYGNKVALTQSATGAASAVVDSTASTGIPASAGVTVSSTSSGGVVASSRSHIIPFAFKAIHLLYNKDGDMIKRETNMGKQRPRKRGGVASAMEADSDPLYHMGGLFYRAPPDEGGSSKDVFVHDENSEPLRILVK